MMTVKDLMDPVEQERYEAFCKKHKDCEFASSIGGKVSIYITPTGLGYTFQCTCNGCDETEDITNTDNW